jgi:acyl carrier protein
MVSDEQVLLEIRDVVERELALPREVKASDRLVEDLGLDSMTLTTLAVALEDRFQVILSDAEAARIQTVGELARYVVTQWQLSVGEPSGASGDAPRTASPGEDARPIGAAS